MKLLPMVLQRKLQKIIMVVSFLILCANTNIQSTILGTVFAATYFLAFIALLYTQDIIRGKREMRLFTASALVIAYASISNSLFYYFYKITPYTTLITLIFPFLGFMRTPEPLLLLFDPVRAKIRELVENARKRNYWFMFIFLILEGFLFSELLAARTTETLVSPWHNLDFHFFIIFAISTMLLFFLTWKKTVSVRWTVILHIVHFLLIYSVAIIVYQLGFGYDGFIHRAAQSHIMENGFIAPKTPFYIGQYALVTMVSHLTLLPIFFIDTLLVPLIAAIFIPWAIFLGLHYGLKTSFHDSLIAAWLLPWIFPLSLHLTTPHNFTLMLFIVVMFVGLWKKNFTSHFLMLTLGVFAALVHPLLGLPLFLFTLCWFFYNKKTKKWLLSLFTLATAISVPGMFALHNLLQGNGLPQLTNPIFGLKSFGELFHLPYWISRQVNFFWDALYLYHYAILPFAGLLGTLAYLRFRKKHPRFSLYFAFSIGLILCAFIMRISIQFPQLASFEKDDYPKRLLIAAVVPLLPMLMFALTDWLSKQKQSLRRLFCLLFPIALMLSFYFAYPQDNPKVHFPGYNMTLHDIHAVQYIHEDAGSQPYIVLSNALVSTAALQEYGFAKYYDINGFKQFYYSSPSGSPLYRLYQKMVYEGTKRAYIEEAMHLAGVQKAYFVINDYWSNFANIVMQAKINSDQYVSIDDGKIFVFTYSLAPESTTP